MNSLDSRSLRYGDTFAQKFSRPGRVHYYLGSAAGQLFGRENAFSINVKQAARNRTGKQHNVLVRMNGRELVADPPELEVEAGDLVLWSAFDATIPGFYVSGQSENISFDSAALSAEAVYTHAFGSPGEYQWEDAHHGSVSGKIAVTTPDIKSERDRSNYQKGLTQGGLVVIRERLVEPPDLEIWTGQTVFFAVEKADGISITDRRLKIKMPLR
jgi:plastocyanin